MKNAKICQRIRSKAHIKIIVLVNSQTHWQHLWALVSPDAHSILHQMHSPPLKTPRLRLDPFRVVCFVMTSIHWFIVICIKRYKRTPLAWRIHVRYQLIVLSLVFTSHREGLFGGGKCLHMLLLMAIVARTHLFPKTLSTLAWPRFDVEASSTTNPSWTNPPRWHPACQLVTLDNAVAPHQLKKSNEGVSTAVNGFLLCQVADYATPFVINRPECSSPPIFQESASLKRRVFGVSGLHDELTGAG